MDLPEELLIGAAAGVAKGVHDRNNDALLAQGIRPSWSRRHPLLVTLLWVIALLPVPFIAIYGGIPALLAVAEFDKHHGNTGLIDLVVFTSPVWVLGIAAYCRAERRWNRRADPPVVDVEPYRR